MRACTDSARGRGHRRHGAALTELAVALPLLLLIVLGAVDFGRFGYTFIGVTNAARAGGGYTCMNRYTTATYDQWVQNTTQAVQDQMSGFPNAPTIVLNPVWISGRLDRVGVQVSYQFSTLFTWPGIPATATIRRTAVFQVIR